MRFLRRNLWLDAPPTSGSCVWLQTSKLTASALPLSYDPVLPKSTGLEPASLAWSECGDSNPVHMVPNHACSPYTTLRRVRRPRPCAGRERRSSCRGMAPSALADTLCSSQETILLRTGGRSRTHVYRVGAGRPFRWTTPIWYSVVVRAPGRTRTHIFRLRLPG